MPRAHSPSASTSCQALRLGTHHTVPQQVHCSHASLSSRCAPEGASTAHHRPVSYSATASSCTDLVHAGQDQWVTGLVLQGPWRCRVPGSLLLLDVQGERGRQLAVRKWGAPGNLECLLQGTGCSSAWPGQQQVLRAGKAPKGCTAVGASFWWCAVGQQSGQPAQ